MDTQRYDAREILKSYVAALNKPSETIIRDAAELGHPKDIIKFVLQHCLKTMAGAEQQEFLREAYLSLGNFQQLTDEERKAVTRLAEMGALGLPQTGLQDEQAKNIAEVAAPLQPLIDRAKAELAVLLQELQCLQAPPETTPVEQGSGPPDSDAAAAPSTAGSASAA